jgi:ligand-binding SRPBCC domain-containing protein
VHSDVDWNRGFTDTQAQGPFKQWVHRHSFCEIAEGLTEVSDEVHAIPGKGLWNGLLSRLMWLNLPFLFAYRGWKTRRMLKN